MLLALGLVFLVVVTAVFLASSRGGVVSHPLPADPRTVEALVRVGRKLDAIKLYRDTHQVTLAEAKDAVEAMARGEAPPAPPTVEEAHLAPAEVDALVRAGQLIDAIKLYRETHGVGLAEAKDAVEARRAQLERG
jgi:ribosomal protein L7/L12